MEWNKFRRMSESEKIQCFYPKLRARLQKTVRRYNKDFPKAPFKEDGLDSLATVYMEFVLLCTQWLDRKGTGDGTQDWCDRKRISTPEDEGVLPTMGGNLLGSIRYYGRLAFGWRLHKKNSSCAPGLMQILMDYFQDEQHLMIPWLIRTDLNKLTTADAVREFQSYQTPPEQMPPGRPTAERYSMSEDALRQMIFRL